MTQSINRGFAVNGENTDFSLYTQARHEQTTHAVVSTVASQRQGPGYGSHVGWGLSERSSTRMQSVTKCTDIDP